MHMGYLVSTNLHQEILLAQDSAQKPTYVKFPEVPPMIALACGKKAVSYGVAEGAKAGEDVMEMFFGNDLGFSSKFLIRFLKVIMK